MQRNVKGAQCAGHCDECTSFRHCPSQLSVNVIHWLDACVHTYVCFAHVVVVALRDKWKHKNCIQYCSRYCGNRGIVFPLPRQEPKCM